MSDIGGCRVILQKDHPLYGKKGKMYMGDDACVFPKEHGSLFVQVNSPGKQCNPHIPISKGSNEAIPQYFNDPADPPVFLQLDEDDVEASDYDEEEEEDDQ